MKIARVWAMPNRYTFKIPVIRDLVSYYVGNGKGWVDPFAGFNSPAEITNDLNPDAKSTYHLDAHDFVDILSDPLRGCILDPPYSLSAVAMFYKGIGLKSRLAEDPTGMFKKVRDKIGGLIVPGGIVISFGWNSNGFGKKRGFKIIEILLVAHGGGHNDTIITVEEKNGQLGLHSV